MKKCLAVFIMILSFSSCKESDGVIMSRLVREWEGREIMYPNNMHFSVLGNDTNYLPKSE